MLFARLRQFAEAHHRLRCVAGIVLILLQPFIAVHFRCDGLEDEPQLRVRSASETTQFEVDARADHSADRETTIFAQTWASIDHPHALHLALGNLLAMILALLPLVVVLVRLSAPAEREIPERVPHHSGAPPAAEPWRRLPPTAAPPLGI
ncbi:hypothetical protein VAPA_1c12900 [Variovorax paradoxus B4]|uniref:Transmembrane protein n=1 Tax=Variovorax paradoxus B4 TaxID=1246301 RepID=T1X8B4_VARPD|nr:hypothetical protein [Variovorax paradoxus]AGU48405.1 hypothetical protein VAPA_1c12900 [Variovorax paradoxus B4]